MVAEVRWTIRARREVKSALVYLLQRQPDAIDTVVAAINSQIERLSSQPYLGSVFQRTKRGEIRETLAASYRIFYRVQYGGRVVLIKSVRHARRRDPDFLG